MIVFRLVSGLRSLHQFSSLERFIPRFHYQATSSNHQANVFKTRVHDVCSNCLMFASLCRRGITTVFFINFIGLLLFF